MPTRGSGEHVIAPSSDVELHLSSSFLKVSLNEIEVEWKSGCLGTRHVSNLDKLVRHP